MTNFERRLYADPDADLDTLWWDLVEQYQQVRRPDGRHAPDWAAKIHLAAAPVYYQNYLYGELFASQLDATLAARTGGLVDRRDAGALLVRRRVRARRVAAVGRAGRSGATGEPLSAAHLAAPVGSVDGARAARTGRGRGRGHPRGRSGHRRAPRGRGLPGGGARPHPGPPARGRGRAARRRRRGRHRAPVRPPRHRRGRSRLHLPRRALGRVPRPREHGRPRARRRARRPHRRGLARRVRPRRAHDGPHDARRAAAAAQGDVRARRERRRVVDPSPEPRTHRLHRRQGGDGERVEEPVARARARGHHREHGRPGHGDVADPGRLPRRHRSRRASPKVRWRPRTRRSPATTARRTTSGASGCPRRSRAWSCSCAPSSPASSWAPPSPSTAAPTSSDPSRSGAVERWNSTSPTSGSAWSTRSPTTRRWCAAIAGSPTPRPTSAPTGSPTISRRPASGPATTSRCTSTTAPSTSRHARRVQAARGPDQRQLPLRRRRAALPARRRRRARRSCSTASSRRRSRRCATELPLLTAFVVVDDDSGAPRRTRRRRRRVRSRARGVVAGARLRAAIGRRPLHPLHRRHHRDAQGRHVARRGHLLRRVRRRQPRRRRRSPARRRWSTRSTCIVGACPPARSCTAPRTGWRSARSTPAAPS